MNLRDIAFILAHMAESPFSIEDKRKIFQRFEVLAEDIASCPSLQVAAKKAGREAIGEEVVYFTLKNWAKLDEEFEMALSCALLGRAEAYQAVAEAEFKKLEERTDMYYDVWVSKGGDCREMNTLVNKAKLVIERCERFAGQLAPEVYGDYYHEIKKCEEAIKSMQKQIIEMVSGRV